METVPLRVPPAPAATTSSATLARKPRGESCVKVTSWLDQPTRVVANRFQSFRGRAAPSPPNPPNPPNPPAPPPPGPAAAVVARCTILAAAPLRPVPLQVAALPPMLVLLLLLLPIPPLLDPAAAMFQGDAF